MLDLYYHACDEYKRMLDLPSNNPRRLYGVAYMGFLRDFIAVMESRDGKEVHTRYSRAEEFMKTPTGQAWLKEGLESQDGEP